jgi:ParB-like chromosome segregation protein Spo0J
MPETANPTGVTYLRTTDVPLDELTPFPGNAKRGDVDQIRASLRRNGQYRSLVVREIPDGPLIVLAGNHTMQALTAEGHHTARCEIVLCDDATARRINLVDNRAAELGDYDNEALAELLEPMAHDLDGTGFTSEYLDDLLANLAPPEHDDWADAFEKVPDGDKQHATRTFSLTTSQADMVDEAISAASKTLIDEDGNRNAAALTAICDVYLRSRLS